MKWNETTDNRAQRVELPPRPPHTLHLHLHDRERREPRGAGGKSGPNRTAGVRLTWSQNVIKELRKQGQEAQLEAATAAAAASTRRR